MKKDKDNKVDIEIDASEIQAEFEKMETEKAELTADLQRTRADFENYRKQIEIQKENERQAVKLATVMKFLPLIDDIDRAVETYTELAPLKKSLEKNLKDLGLAKIPSEAGTEFNPDTHEAITMEGEGEKQVITETLRPGYFYEKEVLRPAMVKVVGK
ncbi:MAG: nucleotide exchange factor GrpE [Candidatus Saccharibacteria bacterium]|nr:nucleotide exchange factor GrpE [Candidatus Saccharibacteria bacterium]